MSRKKVTSHLKKNPLKNNILRNLFKSINGKKDIFKYHLFMESFLIYKFRIEKKITMSAKLSNLISQFLCILTIIKTTIL